MNMHVVSLTIVEHTWNISNIHDISDTHRTLVTYIEH